MDRQKIFNRVRRHLLKQDEQCADRNGVCQYRRGELRCAIGALIPDRLYDAEMEGNYASRVMRQFPKVAKHLGIKSKRDAAFLDGLQELHDSYGPESWDNELRRFARRHRLVA